jgi:hypothetical protein
LFDLVNDPTEKVNLYDTSDAMRAVQAELYTALAGYSAKAAAYLDSGFEADAEPTWQASEYYIVPWVDVDRRRLAQARKARGLTSMATPAFCGRWSGSTVASDAAENTRGGGSSGKGAGRNSYGLFSAVSKTAAAKTVAALKGLAYSSTSSSSSSSSSSSTTTYETSGSKQRGYQGKDTP